MHQQAFRTWRHEVLKATVSGYGLPPEQAVLRLKWLTCAFAPWQDSNLHLTD